MCHYNYCVTITNVSLQIHKIYYYNITYKYMLYSDNGVTRNYNAKDNTKSNWSTAYFHCGPCPIKMTSKFQ